MSFCFRLVLLFGCFAVACASTCQYVPPANKSMSKSELAVVRSSYRTKNDVCLVYVDDHQVTTGALPFSVLMVGEGLAGKNTIYVTPGKHNFTYGVVTGYATHPSQRYLSAGQMWGGLRVIQGGYIDTSTVTAVTEVWLFQADCAAGQSYEFLNLLGTATKKTRLQ